MTTKYSTDWNPAPSQTEWGSGMYEGLVELSRDHSLRLFVGDSQTPQVDKILHAAEDFPELLDAILYLRQAADSVLFTGEFATWVNDQSMPWAAAKDLSELEQALTMATSTIRAVTGRIV